MKSRVDEPDAEGPQDAPEVPFGAPTASREVSHAGSLAEIFGHAPGRGDHAESTAAVASREKLAELFGRPPAAEPETGIHWAPPGVAAAVLEEAVPDEAAPEEPAVAGEPFVDEPVVVDEVAEVDEPVVVDEVVEVDETAVVDEVVEVDETAVVDAPTEAALADHFSAEGSDWSEVSDPSTGSATDTDLSATDTEAVDEPWIDELGLTALVHENDTEPDEPLPVAAVDDEFFGAPQVEEPVAAETSAEPVVDDVVIDEPVTDEPVIDEPVLDEPPADELPPYEPEPHFAGSLFAAREPEPNFAVGPLSDATAAKSRTVEPRVPATGTFGPSRSAGARVRRTLFGSRARTAASVTASIVLVAAIVGGAAYAAQTVAAQNRVVAAQSGLEAAEAAIGGPTTILDTAYADYDASKIDARAAADTATPSLAAVDGLTEEAPLDAANAALAALVAELDADGPPPAPAPYERAAVGSDPDEVEAATRSARDYADEVKAAISGVQSLTNGLTERMTALTLALNALGASLPATAAAIAEEHPLAEQSFRDAVVAAADAVVAAQAAGDSGDAELLAYAAAVRALQKDQARAFLEAANEPRSGTTTPGTGTSRPEATTPPKAPAPTPTTPPAPDPTPTPDPTPEPEPTDP